MEEMAVILLESKCKVSENLSLVGVHQNSFLVKGFVVILYIRYVFQM